MKTEATPPTEPKNFMTMEIFRITIESPFTGQIYESHFFDTEENAFKCMKRLKAGLEDEDSQKEVLGACYTPDSDGEFSFTYPL